MSQTGVNAGRRAVIWSAHNAETLTQILDRRPG